MYWPSLFLFLFLSLPLSLITARPSSNDDLSAGKTDLQNIDIIPIIEDLLSGKILGEIVSYLNAHPEVQAVFPNLREILGLANAEKIEGEAYSRGLLKSIEAHPEFKSALSALEKDLQDKLISFISGSSATDITKGGFQIPPSPAAKEHFKKMEESGATPASRRWLNAKRESSPAIFEDAANSKPMTVYVAAEFDNWGLTVKNKPAYTFVPTTIIGLANVVKFAKANNKRVRAAGYRHTWTNMYSENDEIFVSMLDTKTATSIPDPSSILPDSPSNAANEFKKIELAEEDVPGSGGKKRLARIGAAVTNEEFRRWAIKNNAWTVPMNVVMVEITFGGSNVPICHGGGIKHKTLSDIVRQVEYIDANGKPQAVSDPKYLKAAAGSFGLLGIVTHITLELDKMTYAVMKPLKQDVNLAIPPPPGFIVPAALRKVYSTAQIQSARDEFIAKAENDYYSEWFWFPYQKQAFVNCWNNTEDQTGVIDYPTAPDLFLQWVQGWLGGVINDDPLFRAFPGHWQAVILSTLTMLIMPPQLGIVNTEIRTYLIDGLHFRRGVQNMRVRDIELQIPIPPSKNDPTKPDWTVVQQAWWDAISIVYADKTAPMRIALEMRIMADSDMIMAPQTNNSFGTASIEVLTTMAAAAEGVWEPFAQKIADKWMSYTANGQRLNTRPHWAKEWDGLTVDGMQWSDYLKQVSYKQEIPVFKGILAKIGEIQGWTVADLKARFSCSLLDKIFFN